MIVGSFWSFSHFEVWRSHRALRSGMQRSGERVVERLRTKFCIEWTWPGGEPISTSQRYVPIHVRVAVAQSPRYDTTNCGLVKRDTEITLSNVGDNPIAQRNIRGECPIAHVQFSDIKLQPKPGQVMQEPSISRIGQRQPWLQMRFQPKTLDWYARTQPAFNQPKIGTSLCFPVRKVIFQVVIVDKESGRGVCFVRLPQYISDVTRSECEAPRCSAKPVRIAWPTRVNWLIDYVPGVDLPTIPASQRRDMPGDNAAPASIFQFFDGPGWNSNRPDAIMHVQRNAGLCCKYYQLIQVIEVEIAIRWFYKTPFCLNPWRYDRCMRLDKLAVNVVFRYIGASYLRSKQYSSLRRDTRKRCSFLGEVQSGSHCPSEKLSAANHCPHTVYIHTYNDSPLHPKVKTNNLVRPLAHG